MSPRRSAVVDAPAPVVVDPAEALKRRAAEQFVSAVETYRSAVATAAGDDGQLPADQLDAVVDACRITTIPVDQFADDVQSWRQHRNKSDAIERLRSDRQTNAPRVAELVEEIKSTERRLEEMRRELVTITDVADRTSVSVSADQTELENRFPHLFADPASLTPETITKKLRTRAFFAR